MQPTRAPSAARRTVRGDDVDLSVAEVGPSDAPAVVIAHGVGSSARFVVEAFAGPVVHAEKRLVAYDLRGHGESGPARARDDQRLEHHIVDLATVAVEVGARIIGGVSLGGHAAAALASGCVERRDAAAVATLHDRGLEGLIVCLPAWTGRAVPGDGPHAAVADEIRTVGATPALQRATSDPSVAPWLRALLRRDWGAADTPSLEAALTALDGGEAPDERALAAIGVPTGVVGWPDDPGHPWEIARRWGDVIPAAALETVTMDEVGGRRSSLGEAAVRALARARS